MKKQKPSASIPPRAKNGVKVYYEAEDEHYLREQARKNGLTIQQYLKRVARRQRLGLLD